MSSPRKTTLDFRPYHLASPAATTHTFFPTDQIDMQGSPESKIGVYYLPDHASEQMRLNFQHEMVKVILDGELGRAPVRNPANVLDVATGTGIWAMQYGEQHPESKVLGIDLGMPKPVSHPSNCQFLHHDAEHDPWNFPQSFDYVHFGHVVSCFENTKTVMQKTLQHLTPGGWVEFHDTGLHFMAADETVPGTAIEKWALLATKGAASVGRDLTKTTNYSSWLRQVGFTNVIESRALLPSNTWPMLSKDQKVGAMYNQILTSLVDSLTQFLILAGLTSAEAEDLKIKAKQDVLNPDIHIAFPFHVIYAQKPYVNNQTSTQDEQLYQKAQYLTSSA